MTKRAICISQTLRGRQLFVFFMADFGGFRTIEQNSTRSRGTLQRVALQSGTWSIAAWVHPEVDGLTHFRTSLRESII